MESEERFDKIEQRLAKVETAVDRLLAVSGSDQGPTFPEPLASALGRYRSAVTHNARFFSLIDAGEIALKYSCAVAMSFAPEEATVSLFETPPPLGSFAAKLNNFLNETTAAETPDPILQTLIRSFRRENGKPTGTARYLLDEFVTIRNRERGHSSVRPDGAYESLWRQMESVLSETLQQCGHLRYHLLRVDSLNVGKSDWLEYSTTLLTGVVPTAAAMPIFSKDRVRHGSVCLWDGAQRLLCLSPLVQYRVCSGCGVEHSFFLDRVDSKGLHFHSYAANHRIVLQGTLERT